MLRSHIEQKVQDGPITKNGVLLLITLIVWKFNFSIGTSFGKLTSQFNYDCKLVAYYKDGDNSHPTKSVTLWKT